MTISAPENQTTGNAVSLAIPRWQWRTVAGDLSSLFHCFPAPIDGAGKQVEEIHLICRHSSHAAVLRGESLQLRWRKEIGPEGFELWDTILDVEPPFSRESLSRLWNAWGLEEEAPRSGSPSVAAFLVAISRCPSVLPVRLVRRAREESLIGISCTLETISIAPSTRVDSFAIEHEDPALMAQLLVELGFDARDNINLVQGLRSALGLPAAIARK